jgi:hypothetical protein
MTSKARTVVSFALLLGISLAFGFAAFRSTLYAGYLGAASARPVILASICLLMLAAALGFTGSDLARKRAALGFAAAALLLVGAAAVASGTAFQLLAALLILTTALGVGTAFLALLRVEAEFSPVERIAMATGLGLGLLSHLAVVLGILGALKPWIAFTLLAGLLAATRRSLLVSAGWVWRASRNLLIEHAPEHLLIFGAQLVFLSLVAVQAMAPPIGYDDLHYHLFVAQRYVAEHRLLLFPDILQTYFYQGVEMLYTLGFLVGGAATAVVLNGSLGVLTALGLAGLARRVSSPQAAWFSGWCWVTTPLVAGIMTNASSDLGSALFCLLSAIAAYACVRGANWRMGLLAGIFAGFAVSSKLNGALAVLALVSVLALALWVSRRFGDSLRLAASYGAGAALTGFVWPLLRFVQTGNPVCPFLNGIFHATGLTPVNDWFNFSDWGMGTSLRALLALPWDVTFHGDRFVEAVHPYVMGPGFLLALAGCIFAGSLAVRELRWSVGIVSAYVAALFFLRAQYLRYLTPVWPLVALIAGISLARLFQPVSPLLRRVAVTVFCSLVSAAALVIWLASNYNIPERVPFRVIFGTEPRAAYLARTVAAYPAFEALGRACSSPGPAILSMGNEFAYLCPQMIPWQAPRASFVYRTETDSTYREALRELGIGFVVVDSSSVAVAEIPFVNSGFLDRAGEVLYAGRSVTAIKILGPGEARRRNVVRAQQPAGDVPYRPGLLEPLDPGFERAVGAESAWAPGWVSRPGLAIGRDTNGYPAASEGQGALHINLPGPSDDRQGQVAAAAFPKAAVRVEPGRTYVFSYDLLCSGLIQAPLVTLRFAGSGGVDAGAVEIVSDAACDTQWRRLRATFAVPDGGTLLSPEFGFTFRGEFPYARYLELDRLGLELLRE